jgi:hypothetical protein
MDWQPIETAPKDQVILYYPAVFKPGRGMTLPEWVKVGRAEETPFRKPSHWLPLPAAPRRP